MDRNIKLNESIITIDGSGAESAVSADVFVFDHPIEAPDFLGTSEWNEFVQVAMNPGGAGNVMTSNGSAWGSEPPTGGGGGGGGGGVQAVTQVNHGFSAGQVVYLNGSTYALAKADSATKAETVGIISSITSPDIFQLTLSGYIKYLSGFTAGTVYFLSATVAGAITAVEPTAIGAITKPILIADSTTSGYVLNYRGAIIGGANARSHTFLSSNATSSICSVSEYEAGDLSGWIYISAAPLSYRFYTSVKWAKTGAGTDFNVNTQTTGDIPPLGFSIMITSAGLLQCTLPSIAGFSYAEINYAINAPAVGSAAAVGQVPLGGLVAVMPNIDAINAWQPPATGVIKDGFMRADGTIINAGHASQGCLLAVGTVLPSMTAKYLKGNTTSGSSGGSNVHTPSGTNAASAVPASGLTFSGSSSSYTVSVPAHYHGFSLLATGQTLASTSITSSSTNISYTGIGVVYGRGSLGANRAIYGDLNGSPGSMNGFTPQGWTTFSNYAAAVNEFVATINHDHGTHTHTTDIGHTHGASTVTGSVGLVSGQNGNAPFSASGANTPSGSITGTATAAAQVFTGTEANTEPAYIETVWVIRVK